MTDKIHTPASRRDVALDNSRLSALGLAEAARSIRQGQLTSEDYTAALVQKARERSDLNAFVTIDEDAVLQAARAADKAIAAGSLGALDGLPIGIKDSYLTKGVPTSLGLGFLADFVPEEDADAVQKIKEEGALVFGKNNLVEMSFGLTGHNESFGQVRNPVSTGHVSGGSSSGSAAAVAAGIVPASLGGDTIGSIRVPAALCGVVGFKPTTGRWPRQGVAPISHTLDTTGVIARSVEDCALIDGVVTGEPTLASPDSENLNGVRLIFAPRQSLELVDAEVEANFLHQVDRLRAAGAEVLEVDLGTDFYTLAQTATWSIFFPETMDAVSDFIRRHGIPTTFEAIVESLKPDLQGAWRYMVMPDGGGATSAETYQTALNVTRPEIARRLQAALSTHRAQAFLQPTTPCTAPSIDQQDNFTVAGREVSNLVLANHTVVASLLGLPGISLPAGLSNEGLPFGLELDAPRDDDQKLLALARRIEAVLGNGAN